MAAVTPDHLHDHHHHGPTGLMRWITTTNHKDIGTTYLVFSFIMFLSGGVMALTIRAELFQPGLQVVQPEFFNQLTTMHGLVMVFGAIMPAFVGFANWQIPLMIGASDMAFARMNNWSFWLLPPAAILLVGSFFVPGGASAAGWTLYAPLSIQMGMGMDMTIFAIHILGISSIMGAINIVVTILNMRAPGMTLMKMPLFCWTWLITAYLLIAVMPVLAGAVTMVLADRHFGTSFFNAAGGGDPVLHRHARHRPALLHVRHHAHRRPHRGEGLQLGGHHVARFHNLRDAHAVRRGFHFRLHHGRLHRPDLRHHSHRHPGAGHLLRRGPLPLRAGGGFPLRPVRRHLLLDTQVDRAHV